MHILLTGPIRAGKSTALDGALTITGRKPYGFRTRPAGPGWGVPGFLMEPASPEDETPPRLFAWEEAGAWHVEPRVFEEMGISLLREAFRRREEDRAVLIMDELGFFENMAPRFRDKVLACLDQEEIPVLGVVKQKDTPFLESARNHRNVQVIPVTPENRDTLPGRIAALLEENWRTEGGDHVPVD